MEKVVVRSEIPWLEVVALRATMVGTGKPPPRLVPAGSLVPRFHPCSGRSNCGRHVAAAGTYMVLALLSLPAELQVLFALLLVDATTAGRLAQASHGCNASCCCSSASWSCVKNAAWRQEPSCKPSVSGTTQLSSSSLKLSTAGLITIARYMQWLAAPHVEIGSVLAARWQLHVQTGGSCCTFEITTRLCTAYSRPCSKCERCVLH